MSELRTFTEAQVQLLLAAVEAVIDTNSEPHVSSSKLLRDMRDALVGERASRAALLADRPGDVKFVLAALERTKEHGDEGSVAWADELIGLIESLAAQLAAREEEVKRLRESDVRYRGFVEWFDLYGVSINTVADPRGSYRLNWHRGEVFGNTMNELIDAVDTSIAATKEPTR